MCCDGIHSFIHSRLFRENLSLHDVLQYVSEQTHMFKRFPQALPALPPMTA